MATRAQLAAAKRRRVTRELEKSEHAIACPLCQAPAGSPCVYWHNNEQGVSAVAHVERKRAAGRAWRIERIFETLASADLENGDLRELAATIDDALHPGGPGICGPAKNPTATPPLPDR